MSSRAQHYREAERLLEALPPDKRGRHAGDEGSGADAGGITRPCKGIDECRRCALFRDGIQFCSGLVGLVVCVGGHGGGANRLALAGRAIRRSGRRGPRGGGRRLCKAVDCARSTRGVPTVSADIAAGATRTGASSTTAATSVLVRVDGDTWIGQ
jgi:hypothetical protein